MSLDRTEALIEPQEQTVARECDTHGPYQAYSIDLGDGHVHVLGSCPKCSEAKAEADRKRETELQEIERRSMIAARVAAAAIPERFADKQLADFIAETEAQQRVLAVCKRFAETDKRGMSMVFCGVPGTGKTHLACGTLRAWAERGRRCLYTTVRQAVRSIKGTYRRDATKTEDEVIRNLVSLDLLVLDEVGVQQGSEHELLLLFELINERYAGMKSTILISNLNKEELGDYLGDRMMDRFREGGAVLALDWESWRGKRVV